MFSQRGSLSPRIVSDSESSGGGLSLLRLCWRAKVWQCHQIVEVNRCRLSIPQHRYSHGQKVRCEGSIHPSSVHEIIDVDVQTAHEKYMRMSRTLLFHAYFC